MFDGLPHWLRASLFSLTAVAIWANFSLPGLLNNIPADFQAAGSIVVVFAILSYGRDRSKRENALANATSNSLISAHNYVHAELEFHKSVAENTANMHTLAYLKVLRTLGLQDTEAGDTDEAIKDIEAAMANDSQHNELYSKLQAASEQARSAQEYASNLQAEQGSWLKLVTRIELLFLVLGTLQWGYGDRLVVVICASGVM